jgi:hypothetical protein
LTSALDPESHWPHDPQGHRAITYWVAWSIYWVAWSTAITLIGIFGDTWVAIPLGVVVVGGPPVARALTDKIKWFGP